jgi:DNA replication ATP-dependent helicase Dna2
MMVASFSLGDPDVIRDEDELLLQLNRFNVMASRARAKLVVLVSDEVAKHLDTLRSSGLLKTFVSAFCRTARPVTLGYLEGGRLEPCPGSFAIGPSRTAPTAFRCRPKLATSLCR